MAPPATPAALLEPLLLLDKLPDNARRYLELLADSSTSPGGMVRVLMHVFLKGASGALHAVRAVANPVAKALDEVAEEVAEVGVSKLESLWGRTASQLQAGPCLHGFAPTWEDAACGGEATTPVRLCHRQSNLEDMFASPLVCQPCSDERCEQVKDDSFLPLPNLHPLHRQALVILLSMMMQGPIGAVADAVPAVPWLSVAALSQGIEQPTAEFVTPVAAHSAAAPAAARQAYEREALLSAPSLALPPSTMADGTHGTSRVASRVLRADSRCPEHLAAMPGVVMDVVSTVLKTADAVVRRAGSLASDSGETLARNVSRLVTSAALPSPEGVACGLSPSERAMSLASEGSIRGLSTLLGTPPGDGGSGLSRLSYEARTASFSRMSASSRSSCMPPSLT
eukprot:364283-Chlamydomonas_euryale.AAC.5